jgi:hypothetical protein
METVLTRRCTLTPTASKVGVHGTFTCAVGAGELDSFDSRMKSIALAAISKPDKVRAALDDLLPGQREPWLLLGEDGDPIAYFHLMLDGSDWQAPYLQADVSGRHHDEDDAVNALLSKIAAVTGGRIRA